MFSSFWGHRPRVFPITVPLSFSNFSAGTHEIINFHILSSDNLVLTLRTWNVKAMFQLGRWKQQKLKLKDFASSLSSTSRLWTMLSDKGSGFHSTSTGWHPLRLQWDLPLGMMMTNCYIEGLWFWSPTKKANRSLSYTRSFYQCYLILWNPPSILFIYKLKNATNSICIFSISRCPVPPYRL